MACVQSQGGLALIFLSVSLAYSNSIQQLASVPAKLPIVQRVYAFHFENVTTELTYCDVDLFVVVV